MTDSYRMLQKQFFCEKINLKKLEYIYHKERHFDAIFKQNQKVVKREDKNYNIWANIAKCIRNCVPIDGGPYGYLLVSYKKANDSKELGRWYASSSIGCQSLLKEVRHTICEDQWLDIDMVNAHPNILNQLLNKHNMTSKYLDKYVSKRESILNKIKDELKVHRDDAKSMIIAMINGGSCYKSELIKLFKEDLFPKIKELCDKPEFSHILNHIKAKTDKNIYGKCISKILQIIENDILESYMYYLDDKELIKKVNLNGKSYYHISLIFDGFQIPYNPLINEDILEALRKNALIKTGYDIPLLFKPMEYGLDIPNDYSVIKEGLHVFVDSFRPGLDVFVKENQHDLTNLLSNGTAYDVMKVIHMIVKDKVVYDPASKMWFNCNVNNIWLENSEPTALIQFAMEIIPIVCEYTIKLLKIQEEKDPPLQAKLMQISSNIYKVIKMVCNAPFIKNIKTFNTLFFKDGFKEKLLGSKPYLLAFNNKVFDFSLALNSKNMNDYVRYIKPDDYIDLTTGYNFPEYDDPEIIQIINNYMNDLYVHPESNGDELKNYIKSILATSLNGDNNEQSVFFHIGRGSNSKSTLFALIEKAFGQYYCSLSAEAFTQPLKANTSNEFYLCKGRRFTTFNEPDDSNGNKLQTPTLKRFGDNSISTLKGKELYKNPVEFKNTTILHGAMNNTPSLSTIDGGITRRLRCIKYPICFVEKPNDTFEKQMNPSFMYNISRPDVGPMFIRYLLTHWVTSTKDQTTIPIPQYVLEASKGYIADVNTTRTFIDEEFELKSDCRVKSSDLFISFKQFSKKMGYDIPSTSKFKNDLENLTSHLKIQFKKTRTGNYWIGLKPKEDSTIQISYETFENGVWDI